MGEPQPQPGTNQMHSKGHACSYPDLTQILNEARRMGDELEQERMEWQEQKRQDRMDKKELRIWEATVAREEQRAVITEKKKTK